MIFIGYTKQCWLEELREQRRKLAGDLRKKTDLRDLFIVKVEIACFLKSELKSKILEEYEDELDRLFEEVKVLDAKCTDLSKIIEHLESLEKRELKKPLDY